MGELAAGSTIQETSPEHIPIGALAALVDGQPVDLAGVLPRGRTIKFLDFESEDGRRIFRHSTAHILAQAVQRLYPGTKLAIGPAIADGFYYDFDPPQPFSEEDLPRLEEEMRRIIAADYPFIRQEVSREEALALFRGRGEDYKVEIIQDLPAEGPITIYRQGEFVDLCAGPHVPSTGVIRAFKLTAVAGAYWRGSEKNKMLQRIYGTSFPDADRLQEYLEQVEEAKRRDHRRLGPALDLFSLHDEGAGFPFFHPRGMIIRNELEDFWRREHRRRGYQEIKTPVILQRSLWERSGHWDHYKDNMYFTRIDDTDYAVKPMNCPGAILIYQTRQHSYREFPIRYAELGLVHRHELSGVLHGLMRVRCFTQDDAHIFMLPSQITAEIAGVIDLIDYFYRIFGFSYHVELSTRPEDAMGDVAIWERATQALRDALQAKGIDHTVNEGEGAFYGPKIDFHLEDCLGRSWQCGTIQLDFLLPEKFDVTYIAEDGQKHRPSMLHRVIFGSIERFIGILTENYGGAFPTWLAPVQVKILPIADRHHAWAQEVAAILNASDIRVEVDLRNEKIGHKIREAELEKVPYMLVIGDREVNARQVAVRCRGNRDQGPASVDELQQQVLADIISRSQGQ